MEQATLTRPADTEPTRKCRQVLDAAAELFMASGYGSVSMDAIAKAAGVSKATLYAYFPSKDRLFATIIASACCSNTMNDGHALGDDRDIGETLREIGNRIMHFLLEERTIAIYKVVLSETGRFPELGRIFWENGPRAFRVRLAEWFGEQTAAGRLNTPDPKVAADQFTAMLRPALFMRACLGLLPAADDAEIEASVSATVDTFLRAFGPHT